MSTLNKHIKRFSVHLNDDEKIQHQDYLKDGGYNARVAIWEYVAINEPIPNELKPILRDILQLNFKGKSTRETSSFWRSRVMDTLFLMQEESITTEAALEKISNRYQIEYVTLERNFKMKKYRRIKDAISSVE